MKPIRKVLGSLFMLGACIALATLLSAQETETSVPAESLSLTPADVATFSSLSEAQNAALLSLLEGTPTLPMSALPDSGTAGTFWSLQNPDSAPLPFDSSGSAVWPMTNGSFLMSDLNYHYSAALSRKTATGGTMQTMALDDPTAPDGGDGTNVYTPNVFIEPDYGTNLYLAQMNLSGGYLTGLASNTVADISYEILTNSDLTTTNWGSTGLFILGSEMTNWTALPNLPVSLTNNLFLRLRSWADDGSGLPIWWQLQYFGTTGVDPNGSAAGDGWSNIQKFQNGWNPNSFYTPPAPQGLTAIYNNSTHKADVSWQPSPSPVTGYTVSDSDGNTFNFPAGTNNFTDDISSDQPDPYNYGNLDTTVKIKAHYAGGDSAWSAPVPVTKGTINGSIIPGALGIGYLAVTALPPNTAAIRLTEIEVNINPYVIVTNYDIPIGNFTNGLCPLPNNVVLGDDSGDTAGNYVWYGKAVGTNGFGLSGAIPLSADYTSPQDNFNNRWLVPPYFDGRRQLKQNLIFQLRAAMMDEPFHYSQVFPEYSDYLPVTFSADYAYAGYYTFPPYNTDSGATYNYIYLDSFQPFEENYAARNFAFNSSALDASGHDTTGVSGDYSRDYYNPYGNGLYDAINDDLILEQPPAFSFSAPTVNGAAISPLLATNLTRWLCSYPLDSAATYLREIGVTNDAANNIFTMFSNVRNYWGLTYLSAQIGFSGPATTTLYSGSSTSDTQGGFFYPETAQPQFQTVEYDFFSPNGGWDAVAQLPINPNLPGLPTFSMTNRSQQFFVPVGSQIQVAGYAKLSVQNGYSGVYGYLGQYFDQAYKITNGIVTTNATGVLSPYGNFFATEPGPTALVTMPDLDTGERGTCTVYAVSLQLDANHDGNMDLSFAGADTTSSSQPFTFWANNNFDRWDYDSDDATNYMDGLNSIESANLSSDQRVPDCHYGEYYGIRSIPTTRDLEDFARLWVCGVTSNLLAALPAGSTITLNWGDVGSPNYNNPTIDLFTAADPDGGIGYLTNNTIAANQIYPPTSPFVQRLAPGGSIQLNAIVFANNWAGNHFIWCGVTNGSGQLNLTITDGNGNVLAQTSQWIQIVDIKQMYERFTVGDNPNVAPLTVATNVTDGLPYATSAFQYPTPTMTNTPYILFVHGWNMRTDDKDNFAETAFKRLYWQGYQGRFGEFRWPTDNGFDGTLIQLTSNPSEKDNFDRSEYKAWESGQGLLNKLTDLNSKYPGHVYMLAHSMGNVVAGEALRLEETNQIVKIYVASQAAVTANVYDPSISPYSFYYSYLGVPLSTSPKTPNIYGGWFGANDGFAAGAIVNFYNTNDYALQRSVWQLDQLLKPDQAVLQGNALLNYGYSGSTNDAQPWNHFYKQNANTLTITNLDIVNLIINHYEAMAFAAQPYTTALGATPNVGNLAGNIYLGRATNPRIWPPDTTGNNYSKHFWHSAEFRGDNIMAQGYWSELLGNESFNLK